MNTNPVTFYVPVNLKPSCIRRTLHPYAGYFLNLLHWKWICWRADEDGYISLKHDYITRVIPRKPWIELRERLNGLGVVYCSKFWTPGKQSMRYQLAPEYRRAKRVICTDSRFARKIHGLRSQQPRLRIHQWLDSHFENLQFDSMKAASIIASLQPEDKTVNIDDYHLLLAEMTAVLTNGDAKIESVDRFGRVHSPITRLPRQLRCCLTVDQLPLTNIDLANSQPLIAGMIAANYLRNRTTAKRLRDRLFSDLGNPYHNRRPAMVETGSPDLLKYLDICQRGRLYESRAGELGVRNANKKEWFTALFGRNDSLNLIRRHYPTLANVLAKLKKKNYRHAAHLMQNAESTIFISGICGRIMKEHPDAVVFTIHDSILTTPDFVDVVKFIIRDEFQTIGITPSLRIEVTQ